MTIYGVTISSPKPVIFFFLIHLFLGKNLQNEPQGVTPRFGHAIICHNQKLIIFGGASKGNNRTMVLNDLWEFSLSNFLK